MKRAPLNTLEKAHHYLLEQKIPLQGERVLIAVSGGPDSMFLLHLFHWLRPQYDLKLAVAHIEHGMRPGDDPKETAFVRENSEALGLPMLVAKIDPSKIPKRGSLEEALREERLRLLKDMATKSNSNVIALGHQMEDQAETFLLRLLRGAGIWGLSSMKPRSGMFLRPLLGIRRKEILNYLHENEIPYIIDPSNEDQRYLRNRIRKELIPILETLQPNIVEAIARTCENLAVEASYIEQQVNDWIKHHADIRNNVISIPYSLLIKEHEAIRSHVIRSMYLIMNGSLKRLTKDHVKKVINLIEKGTEYKQISLPDNMVFSVSKGMLLLKRQVHKGQALLPLQINAPGSYKLWDLPLRIEVSVMDGRPIDFLENRDQAFLDMERVSLPLEVRTFLPGDWFIPLGMEGKKKIQDFFVDLKVPREERQKVPLVLSRGRIVWVAGFRIDNTFRVTKETKKTLLLHLKREGPIP